MSTNEHSLLDNLKIWYINQQNSVKLQIAIINQYNKTDVEVNIDSVLEAVKREVLSIDLNKEPYAKDYKDAIAPLIKIKAQIDILFPPPPPPTEELTVEATPIPETVVVEENTDGKISPKKNNNKKNKKK